MTDISPDDQKRWAEIERLFAQAVELPRTERKRWLSLLAPNEGVRSEVEAMLAAHERVTGILEHSPSPARDDMQPRVEAALGDQYEIVRLLGRGGSATVFLAREHKHDRMVVLKVLQPEVAASVGVHRFLREVHIVARLSHPHIVPLIDSGEADGLLYYVMPHLEGETLRERLTRQGRLPVADAVELLRDIATALDAAHHAGIVHRDLKPENVLCTGNHAYVIDFGIAVHHDVTDARHTQEGMVVGTLGYMSPEQLEGRAVGPASDIFAWGVIAREMLTGAGPLDDDRTLSEIPHSLAPLVRQALEREPAWRPNSAAEVVRRLSGVSGEAMRSRPTRNRPVVYGTGAIAVIVAVVALSIAVFKRASVPLRQIEAPVAVAPLRNETGDSSLSIWGRIAADWLTQGLHEMSSVQVVPWPSVRHAWEELERGTSRPSPALLARELDAGTVVTGAYYRTDANRIGFRLDVTNARNDRLIGSLPAIVVTQDSLERAVNEARERLMGFMALQLDERADALPGITSRPPRFHAYRAFDRGLALYNQQEYGAAAAEFRQAWSEDTSFVVPLIYAAMAHWNREELDWVDTLVTMVQQRRNQLSEYDRLQADYLAALLASDGDRAIAMATRAVEIAPESRAAYNLGRDLIAMDRPGDALRVLEAINPDRGIMRGWPSYWTQLTHARHLSAAHDEELAAARAMRQRFPTARVAWVLEARALAALGRRSSLDSLLALTANLPTATYWSHAATLVVAGEELVVHRDSALGLSYLRQATAWLDRELRADPGRREHRYWLGSAYYDLARWHDADTVFASLKRDFPSRAQYQGLAAVARARVGKHRQAVTLLGAPPRFARGDHSTFRARLAAIAGDTVAARASRQQALSELAPGYAWLHASAFRDFGVPLR